MARLLFAQHEEETLAKLKQEMEEKTNSVNMADSQVQTVEDSINDMKQLEAEMNHWKDLLRGDLLDLNYIE